MTEIITSDNFQETIFPKSCRLVGYEIRGTPYAIVAWAYVYVCAGHR